jgi:hypothetical protein
MISCGMALATILIGCPAVAQDQDPVRKQLITLLQTPRAELVASRAHWIATFESALVNTPETDLTASVRLRLADLYSGTGAWDRSLEQYDIVLNTASSPHLRFTAALDAAPAALQHGHSVNVALAYLDEFALSMEEFRAQGTPLPHSERFDQAYDALDHRRAHVLAGSARWNEREIGPVDKATLASVVAPQYEAAAMMMARYTARFPLDSESPLERVAATMDQADWASLAAALYARVDATEHAQHLRAMALESWRSVTDLPVDSPHTPSAATRQMREMLLAGATLEQFERTASALGERLPPNHEFLTYMNLEALKQSRSGATLATADKVHGLVLQLDRTWYPAEYKNHVNYQWSLIGSATNRLRLGDLEGARERLDELETLDLRGDYFQATAKKLRQNYDQRVARGHSRDLEEQLDELIRLTAQGPSTGDAGVSTAREVVPPVDHAASAAGRELGDTREDVASPPAEAAEGIGNNAPVKSSSFTTVMWGGIGLLVVCAVAGAVWRRSHGVVSS